MTFESNKINFNFLNVFYCEIKKIIDDRDIRITKFFVRLVTFQVQSTSLFKIKKRKKENGSYDNI